MEEMKKRKKVKREFVDVAGMLVFEHHAYFKDYLEAQIGAGWHLIKRSLFDAGYTVAEVNAYRDALLEDFDKICKENGFVKYI